MKTTMLDAKVSPEQVGEFISENFYKELTDDFQRKFPSEVRSLILERSAVETLLKDDSISGIKFMNGLEDVHDTTSRILVLIPANYTVTNSLPNSIISKNGFMTNTGERISLERTWQVLFNHVLNFKKLDSQSHYTKINRGSFMGRTRLTEFLNATDCSKFIYHFGYLAVEDLPYKLIIQPSHGVPMFIEMSLPCPGSSGCPGTNSTDPCALTHITTNFAGNEADAQLMVLRGFRDKILKDTFTGAEVEKYYTISASLLEAIDQKQNQQAIFKDIYTKYIQTSITAIQQNNEATAYMLFQEAMEHLTDIYLYQ